MCMNGRAILSFFKPIAISSFMIRNEYNITMNFFRKQGIIYKVVA